MVEPSLRSYCRGYPRAGTFSHGSDTLWLPDFFTKARNPLTILPGSREKRKIRCVKSVRLETLDKKTLIDDLELYGGIR
jgi:hypothetical protein